MKVYSILPSKKRGAMMNIDNLDQDDRIRNQEYPNILRLYFREITRYPILPHEAMVAAQTRYKSGDEAGRHTMIQHNLRLVVSIAKKFRNRGLDFLDLIQAGAFGLYEAIDRWDPARAKFTTYATYWIHQCILRALRDQGKTIRIPVNIHEDKYKIGQASLKLQKKYERKATMRELCAETDMTPDSILWALKSFRNTTVSFENFRNTADEPAFDNSRYAEDHGNINPEIFALAKKTLCDIAREINTFLLHIKHICNKPNVMLRLIMRYGLDDHLDLKTLEQVGQKYNISREAVRQLCHKESSYSVEFYKRYPPRPDVWLEHQIERLAMILEVLGIEYESIKSQIFEGVSLIAQE